MFRHKGRSRAYVHNLRLAAMLSFVAGVVNISGVLSIKTLTTNETGHFAYFAEELVNRHYATSFFFLLYILSFLLGSFVSSVLIGFTSKINPKIAHSGPMIIEIVVLALVAIFGTSLMLLNHGSQVIAYTLLFAMGMQNSLVTQVSQSTVRTTHLTGLFTDLGIELSQLFFYRNTQERKKLSKSIYLRFLIIVSFFTGCVLGGFLFSSFQLKTVLFASICLIVAFLYDNIRYRFYFFRRKLKSKPTA